MLSVSAFAIMLRVIILIAIVLSVVALKIFREHFKQSLLYSTIAEKLGNAKRSSLFLPEVTKKNSFLRSPPGEEPLSMVLPPSFVKTGAFVNSRSGAGRKWVVGTNSISEPLRGDRTP